MFPGPGELSVWWEHPANICKQVNAHRLLARVTPAPELPRKDPGYQCVQGGGLPWRSTFRVRPEGTGVGWTSGEGPACHEGDAEQGAEGETKTEDMGPICLGERADEIKAAQMEGWGCIQIGSVGVKLHSPRCSHPAFRESKAQYVQSCLRRQDSKNTSLPWPFLPKPRESWPPRNVSVDHNEIKLWLPHRGARSHETRRSLSALCTALPAAPPSDLPPPHPAFLRRKQAPC